MAVDEIYKMLDELEDELKWAFDVLLDKLEDYYPEMDSDEKIQQVREIYDKFFD